MLQYTEAKNFIKDQLKGAEPSFNKIAFENIYPLYGQIDIKGSSDARNWATQQDLTLQLNSVKGILEAASKFEELPIYEQYIYQIDEFLKVLDKKTRYEETSVLETLEKEMGNTDEFFELNQVGVKTIESYEIGTDEYRDHCQDMTPGQPVLSFKLANKVIERNDIDLFANEDEIIDKYKKRYGDRWEDELEKAVIRMKKEL